MSRPLIADIDLDALRHNYRLAAGLAPGSLSVAVLKADAYGHGAVACARALSGEAPMFAVAAIEEAVALREAGIEEPIVLLEGIFSADELAQVEALGLGMAIHSDWQLEAALARRPARPIPVWLKVDSGMHRLGFPPERAEAAWRALEAAPECVCDLHLMSHFATADSTDAGYFQRQRECIVALAERLDAPTCLANSPSILAQPSAHGAINRPGVMLYGADPLEVANSASQQLAPVMSLRSEIIAVRELSAGEPVGYGGRFVTSRPSRIGVVACGYGDGYDRHAVDGTPVLVDGKRTHVAGKVSMDMMTVDLSELPEAGIGSEVVLWGRSRHGGVLSVDEVARFCDTISYTLLTGVLPRVPRRYNGAVSD
ncbi:alanine racemase [Halomonas litopenaei]|uniref:Alanine racemase n=2 Tax=Halomonas TaxID=2745 RepID=A0AAU7KM66_9GAMM|nr:MULTISPECIES: alanine racemase [Halomonas]MAY73070.1 alanine racemase [Halomonas sp.]MBY5939737.1 alanine racemase [Halomonas sp. DP5N14-9]PTL92776.1 alanine racemase [Halomonas sp. SYSU XM8]PTL96320.1 alanine racemase [Halomonas litopenaei]